jgi:hypothetical protein
VNTVHLCATGCGRPTPDTQLCGDTWTGCLGNLLADLRTVCEQRTDSHDNPIRNLADELTVTFTRAARTTAHRVGGRSATTPLPWHEKAADATFRLRSVLGTWASRLHSSYSAKLPDPTDPTGWFQPPPDFTADIRSQAAWLLRHPSWIAQHPDAAALNRDITAAVADAWRAVDMVPDRWYAGPCSVKDCVGHVYGDPHAPAGSCSVCKSTYDMEQRRAFLFAAARDYVMTAAELSRAMPVLLGIVINRKTVSTWANRGLLKVAEYDDRSGTRLYRLGDVEELVRQKVDQPDKVG